MGRGAGEDSGPRRRPLVRRADRERAVVYPLGARVRLAAEVAIPGSQDVGSVVSRVYRTGSGERRQNVRWDRDGRTTRWSPSRLQAA